MLLLVNKPTGWSSHDVVKYVKIHGGYKKVGHAGTLDPLATGLLVLLTDDDTKRMATLVGHDKTYLATIDLSMKSDTRDADWYEWHEKMTTPEHIPLYSDVEAQLNTLVPLADLPIPSFSAKKKEGRRLYKDARAGIHHECIKSMPIYSIEVISYEYPLVTIRCHVGSGTFIRSIAHALGEKLGTGGIIAALRRETIGDYSLTDPTCIQDLADIKQKQ